MGGSNGNGSNGHAPDRVTFDEVRQAARWLGLFGASDLADALRCHPEVARRAITALRVHRLLLDTGEHQDGTDGSEPVWEMVPLPDRHYPREYGVRPEMLAVMEMGGFLLYDQRGLPVRLRSEREMRRTLSTPGARQMHRNRELAYKRQQEATAKRAEEQRIKAKKEKEMPPKWKRRGTGARIAIAEQTA